jgi:hypothetical protein
VSRDAEEAPISSTLQESLFQGTGCPFLKGYAFFKELRKNSCFCQIAVVAAATVVSWLLLLVWSFIALFC